MRIIVKMTFGAHLYGTATSDSDLDYKGIFLRWYLTIADKRDVIEIPFDGDLDINGWDIRGS